MAKSREIQDLLREVRRQGFDVQRGASGHWKIRKEGRLVATLPSTPGGHPRGTKRIIRREHEKLVLAGYLGEFRW